MARDRLRVVYCRVALTWFVVCTGCNGDSLQVRLLPTALQVVVAKLVNAPGLEPGLGCRPLGPHARLVVHPALNREQTGFDSLGAHASNAIPGWCNWQAHDALNVEVEGSNPSLGARG